MKCVLLGGICVGGGGFWARVGVPRVAVGDGKARSGSEGENSEPWAGLISEKGNLPRTATRLGIENTDDGEVVELGNI